MKIKQLKNKHIGKKCTCFIKGVKIEDARIQKEYDEFFICQNELIGAYCEDTLGYEFSWRIDNGGKEDWNDNNVKKLRIVEEPKEYPQLKPSGGTIKKITVWEELNTKIQHLNKRVAHLEATRGKLSKSEFKELNDKINWLSKKVILKPDYDPKDVAFKQKGEG